MEEARASWNVRYRSKEGFDCQLTLRDEDETALAERVKKVLENLGKGGNQPAFGREVPASNGNSAPAPGKPPAAGNGKPPAAGTSPSREASRRNADASATQGDAAPGKKSTAPKYIERDGQLICNQKLANGKVCGAVGKMRDGRYGPFFSCPRYRAHAKG